MFFTGLSFTIKPTCPKCFKTLGNLAILKKRQYFNCPQCDTSIELNQLIQYFERIYDLLEGIIFLKIVTYN